MSDIPAQGLVDSVSRTHLLLAHLDLIPALGEAHRWMGSHHVHVEIGGESCDEAFAQAAAMTLVNLLRRASITVSVSIADGSAMSLAGPWRTHPLVESLAGLGAGPRPIGSREVVIGIGEVEPRQDDGNPQLQLTWDGWVAGVRALGVRLPERNGCVLAPVAAAALCVSEVFHHIIGHLDAGWRPITLSLWNPLSNDPAHAVGTLITRLPDQWTLVGLGHLGQAYAWCIALLPYEEGSGRIWLVDDDAANRANLSTGVLTEVGDTMTPDSLKTRIVSQALEKSGRSTRMIECRLHSSYKWEVGHPEVALIGVDNLQFRRRISDISWPLCVDGGLGSTKTSFAALSIHAFPGAARSSEVPSWQHGLSTSAPLPPAALMKLVGDGVDQCGLVMLAGKAVGAAFVGMVTACLVVAEPLRRLHGAQGVDALSMLLDSPSPRGADSVSAAARLSSVAALQ